MYTITLSPSGDTTGATDTTAIQTAITAVMASTGTTSRCLLLEDGDYYISSKITGTWGTSASWGPLEIKGSGQTVITQVTNNIGMFEFQVPTGGFPAFLTFGNMILKYQTAQSAANTAAVCLGFRSVNSVATGGETVFQIYIDRLQCNNCCRGIANVQPSGQFAVWGVHITNFCTNTRSGAGIWLVSPTAIGQPNINIDHWLDSQSSSACPDAACRIDACDNLVIKNCEFLNVANNLPLIWLSTCPVFVIEACKAEACSWAAVSSAPNNYVNFFQNAYGMVNGFRINSTGVGSPGGTFPPVMFKITGTVALGGAVTLAGININISTGTGTLSIVSCGMKVRFLSPPAIDNLGSGPAVVRLYNSAGDSGSSANIDFANPPGGEMSPDNGNSSITFAPLSVTPTNAGMAMVQIFNTPLTAAQSVTLPTTVGTPAVDNLSDGMECHVVRTAAATGASLLTVGSKTLATGQWTRMKYIRLFPGTPAWVEIASGSL